MMPVMVTWWIEPASTASAATATRVKFPLFEEDGEGAADLLLIKSQRFRP
jgi:hypothetical protein